MLLQIPSLLLWLFAATNRGHRSSSLLLGQSLKQGEGLSLLTGGSCQDSHAILVDVENLRGKSGFSLTHAQVLTALATWSRKIHVSGRLVLVMDHGHEPSALWLPDAEYAIVFAGSGQKADDVLAHDLVPYFSELPHVTVVTADHELIQRCRRASGVQQRLQILAPGQLLEDLNTILETCTPTLIVKERSDEVDKEKDVVLVSNEAVPPVQGTIVLLDHEIKLGGQLLETEALLRLNRGSTNNKRRKKLKLKAQNLRAKLIKQGSHVVEYVSEILTVGDSNCNLPALSADQKNALLARWEKIRLSSGRRREQTGDRVILAEQLRLKLLEKYGDVQEVDKGTENETLLPGKAFILNRKAQSLVFPDNSVSRLDANGETANAPLIMVVVSDTHGMEDDIPLSSGQDVLPDADMLLHLGDFAIDDGPVQECLRKFDLWLAKQPHSIKIVVRGNHDPRQLDFPVSGAICLTKPKLVQIKGYSFYFVPFTRSLTTRSIPRSCDVVVSHVPPKGVLDQHHIRRHHIGCTTLHRGVARMKGGPPALWLCGHIHEGRGSTRKAFVQGNDKETLVINAANANPGIAAKIDYGPAVVKLYCNSKKGGSKIADIVQMDGQYEFINQSSNRFFTSTAASEDSRGELLLAVDLGLRTGVSLFNDEGELLRFHNFQFESSEELQSAAFDLLYQWERDASKPGEKSSISRIAIEGGDPPLRKAWHRAARGERLILHVQPEEWREDLLSVKERQNGEFAKAASRHIARQIVNDYGRDGLERDLGDGEVQTDMAESLVLGLHVARRLGWIESRDPAVRRTPNGDVIVSEAVMSP